MTTRAELVHELARATRAVRVAVAECVFPLPLPTAAPSRERASALVAQLDDYLLPRLADVAAPLLMVVGGPTGAGKSTLVNSLVRAPVSPAGPLRPTTRTPVLVCHPSDTPWFRGDRRLASLVQETRAKYPDPATDHDPAAARDPAPVARPTSGAGPSPGQQLPLLAAPALPPGLALVDAPDIDSVVESNRAVATRLLAAADMWLFVTTPNRYADAVPWRLLHSARRRGAVVALVIARIPDRAAAQMTGLVQELLHAQGLVDLPVLLVPQSQLDRQGLLPEPAIGQLRTWLDALARDEAARASVIGYTLDGALTTLVAELSALASAVDEQVAAAETLAEQVGLAYGLARSRVARGLRVGEVGPPAPAGAAAPARGPLQVLTRKLRWWPRAGQAGPAAAPRHRQTDADGELVTLVRSAALDAAEQVETAWRTHPAGPGLLADGVPQPSPELPWQVLRVAREVPGDRLSEGPRGGPAVGGDPVGVDSVDVDQRLLAGIGDLLDLEAAAWLDRLAGVPLDNGPGQRLRDVATRLDRARRAARLTEIDSLALDPPVAESQPSPEGSPPPPEVPPPSPPPAPAGPDGRTAPVTIPTGEAGE